jgi:hypothetical protein
MATQRVIPVKQLPLNSYLYRNAIHFLFSAKKKEFLFFGQIEWLPCVSNDTMTLVKGADWISLKDRSQKNSPNSPKLTKKKVLRSLFVW